MVEATPTRSTSLERISLDPGGWLSNMVSFAVPAGFRLMIEYVSVSARGRQGARGSQRRRARKRDVRTDARCPIV
jgi:hypothetical protein